MLYKKIVNRERGIITYGITPPKADNTEEKLLEISGKHIERIKKLEIDALVLYDIHDEKDRIKEERPFPFIETVDSAIYAKKYLKNLNIPKIVYRCVGKYSKEELEKWMIEQEEENKFSVFVGIADISQKVRLTLDEAYEMKNNLNKEMLLGGVAIPERHTVLKDEHLRVTAKINKGCSYFITQAVYNLESAKNFLSDYYYYSKENNIELVPIIFTLTPCGSLKTLHFMKWLGISIPRWLENELTHTNDILGKSMKCLENIVVELNKYALEKNIPIGYNIESVAVKKDEIEASIELVESVKKLMNY